jgi:hypothetical protein
MTAPPCCTGVPGWCVLEDYGKLPHAAGMPLSCLAGFLVHPIHMQVLAQHCLAWGRQQWCMLNSRSKLRPCDLHAACMHAAAGADLCYIPQTHDPSLARCGQGVAQICAGVCWQMLGSFQDIHDMVLLVTSWCFSCELAPFSGATGGGLVGNDV